MCDLEATCWRADEHPELAARQRDEAEIIEIGAVRLDPHTLTEVDRFERLVRPVRHPTLSAFCTQLTGISQALVDAEGVPFAQAYAELMAWMGPTQAVDLAAWGIFDHRQLERQAAELGAEAPGWTPHNIKVHCSDWLRWTTGKSARFGQAQALQALGLPPGERPHRALSDALDVVRVLRVVWDPARASAQGQAVLRRCAALDPEPVNRARMAEVDDKARGWFERAVKELRRCRAVQVSTGKAHVRLNDRGRAALALMDLELDR
ncbi:MAG: exonuclease domain-containing protein [Myxococcales bacterium]|nr:exonuclease domain-containing protein [Myxococcales bacterium]